MSFVEKAMAANRAIGRSSGWQLKKYVPDLHEARAFLLAALMPDLILDGGANRGQWAQDVRGVNTDIPIISIEPISENFQQLTRLNLQNHRSERFALSSMNGEVPMQVSSNQGMSSSIGKPLDHFTDLYPGISFTGVETVKAVTLDSLEFLHGKKVFLKLDLEGHEWEALQGASKILGESKEVVAIELETCIRPSRSGERSHYEIVPFLQRLGFRVHHLFTPGVTATGEMNFIDCLFVRG